jgi:alkylation response protein AidB-like acyl-CoA dehydrogenase
MAGRLFAAESALYRTAGLVEEAVSRLEKEGGDDGRKLQAIGEYAAECAMVKVQASEALDFVADEAVQVFGGYGYIEEYPVARAYRDARVNRIFEGTNEINRIVITDWLYRLDRKGKLLLMSVAKEALAQIGSAGSEPKGEIQSAKNLFLSLWAMVRERYGEGWQEQQELLAMLADLAIEIYAAESVEVRSCKIARGSARDEARLAEMLASLCRLHLVEAARGMLPCFVSAMSENDDSFSKTLSSLQHLLPHRRNTSIAMERAVAAGLLKFGSYPFPSF